ncbi:hypothetical protein VOLCADRAFT_99253 [Volvox carteri f. nagariensis]|uniref:Uncharacterized protein n=1 Tax=Volvox carteri f. nagariensis TaxID=3068 RepID=D8UHC2_VOLCA|nr:uncharacterized protein VOLCADRAFT_99253 [Volvox carteri f. nagariensis]EFJ40879.1 hypothetical protein VOLCADRAFT_99253 [Volvox carteri f. nagariensis]|eukprot:XP_002958039.1 hypothetical protein VOLCADRAFT_99253 [Volvox carteri f. nagariensis]
MQLLEGKGLFDKEKATYSQQIYTVTRQEGYHFTVEGKQHLHRPSEMQLVQEVTDRVAGGAKRQAEATQEQRQAATIRHIIEAALKIVKISKKAVDGDITAAATTAIDYNLPDRSPSMPPAAPCLCQPTAATSVAAVTAPSPTAITSPTAIKANHGNLTSIVTAAIPLDAPYGEQRTESRSVKRFIQCSVSHLDPDVYREPVPRAAAHLHQHQHYQQQQQFIGLAGSLHLRPRTDGSDVRSFYPSSVAIARFLWNLALFFFKCSIALHLIEHP